MKIFLIIALVCSASVLHAQTPSQISLRFDYKGAEAMLEIIERDSVNDAAIDSLLAIRGVQIVINTGMYFIPGVTVDDFRNHLKSWVRTKSNPPGVDRPWGLNPTWNSRHAVRILLSELRANEGKLTQQMLEQISAYAPKTDPLEVQVFFIDGSNSGGGPIGTTGLYANLNQSQGDLTGQIANIAHESYHVLQNAVWRKHPARRLFVDSAQSYPVVERLLGAVLAEGTANYAVDPTRTNATGRAMDDSRARYARNATPERIAENFALFDQMFGLLQRNEISWSDMYQQGFTGGNDARFYFVGYEMAKAIDKYCGRACIGALFDRPFADFFKQYIALYRQHPEIKGRFSAATEKSLIEM